MTPKLCAIGEAMIELAPVEGGLYARGFAGDTFNTAWHMAQVLGPRARVGMVTRLGRDALSDAFAAEMVADGLDVSGVSRDDHRRMGLYLIELDGVERSFHYWRETSAARHLADDPQALEAALTGASLIHLSGITLAILAPPARETLFSALARTRSQGARVSFDPNIRARLWPSPEELRQTLTAILPLVDIALPSFDDEETHFGDTSPEATLKRFQAAGVTEVVVKNGAGPVTCHAGQIETPPVSEIRDTTGAGDAFNAGYLAARMMGHPVDRAIRAGQALSSVVLRHPGARAPKSALLPLD
ncbi:sugar kinase [Stagnihabitans tardus]|uniref:Sugar kinase n=1 Tax=Stagnihabitans tardus TaxID=2699202 RepID=A0AAE4YCB6_9RHOB|nr:sugar kinase [Stagnihabitans tardus]NBZ89364.1 sugar kinase [Stagnihabitans tardus]